jgi:(p)ppGpp synthase/HD superfamily hydrolase
MSHLERAIRIAVEAHDGQKDKAGQPYILHPMRIMLRMQTETEMIVGILHDVVEDSNDWSIGRLEQEGFSDEILQAIDCLTRKEDESYENFIARLKGNRLARTVKVADLQDNTNISRIKSIREQDIERLVKYHGALQLLMDDEDGL